MITRTVTNIYVLCISVALCSCCLVCVAIMNPVFFYYPNIVGKRRVVVVVRCDLLVLCSSECGGDQ